MTILWANESYVMGLVPRPVGVSPPGKTCDHVFVTALNSHVSVDHAGSVYPPNSTTTFSFGSYAQFTHDRFDGCVARSSLVHWSLGKLYFQVSPKSPEVPFPPN